MVPCDKCHLTVPFVTPILANLQNASGFLEEEPTFLETDF